MKRFVKKQRYKSSSFYAVCKMKSGGWYTTKPVKFDTMMQFLESMTDANYCILLNKVDGNYKEIYINSTGEIREPRF